MGRKKYTAEEHAEYRRAEDERPAKEEQDRREKADKGAAKRAWILDGGSEADFERAWPGMRDEARRQRVRSADEQAREDQRRISSIF